MSALIDGFWLALFGPFFFAPALLRVAKARVHKRGAK